MYIAEYSLLFINFHNMSNLEQYTLEFPIRTSSKLLYVMISTPEGLSRWFADSVDIQGDTFVFKWEGSEQRAQVVQNIENELIAFKWLEDNHKDHILEMKIEEDSIAAGVALIITDHSDPSDLDFNKRLITSQVSVLQRHFQS